MVESGGGYLFEGVDFTRSKYKCYIRIQRDIYSKINTKTCVCGLNINVRSEHVRFGTVKVCCVFVEDDDFV